MKVRLLMRDQVFFQILRLGLWLKEIQQKRTKSESLVIVFDPKINTKKVNDEGIGNWWCGFFGGASV